MGFFSLLFRTGQLNDDPNQKALANILLEAGIYQSSVYMKGKPLNFKEVMKIVDEAGWSNKEAANRFIHAASMIKPIADEATFLAAKDEAKRLYMTYTSLPRW
ncbi:MAG TPA: hypothetical protein VJ233_12750 [Hyphomicrobiaceae bacterium]|nr:hypothetical protein [Hyphomicrobiaceae bacterium]